MTYEEIVRSWQDGTIGNDRSFADIFTSFASLFAYNSGRMANDKVTFDAVKELFETGTVADAPVNIDALTEMENSSEGWDALMERLGEKEELSHDLVKDFHHALAADTYSQEELDKDEVPGEYKHNDYVGELNEVGAFPQDVPEEMEDLMEKVNGIGSKKALVAAAYFHCQFENIHPFADCNGRSGRLLMNYVLLLRDHPPVVIFDEDKDAYFDALTAWDDDEDLEPMINFLKEEIVKTWKTILE